MSIWIPTAAATGLLALAAAAPSVAAGPPASPGMAQMHEQMMDADTYMNSNKMMPLSPTPESEGELR